MRRARAVERRPLKKHDEVIAFYDNYENDMFDYDGDALASCGFGSDEDY